MIAFLFAKSPKVNFLDKNQNQFLDVVSQRRRSHTQLHLPSRWHIDCSGHVNIRGDAPIASLTFGNLSTYIPQRRPRYPQIPKKQVRNLTEILRESSQFLFRHVPFHLQEIVEHCEQQNGNLSTAFGCLYGPKIHRSSQKLCMNWSNLDALTPAFVSLGPNVGSMRSPILETRQPIPRSLESESCQQHIESSRLSLVLDAGSRSRWNKTMSARSLLELWEIYS